MDYKGFFFFNGIFLLTILGLKLSLYMF